MQRVPGGPGDGLRLRMTTSQTPRALKRIEDVGAVCEAHGMKRMDGPHPSAWLSEDGAIGVAVSGIGSTMTGVHVQHVVALNEPTEEGYKTSTKQLVKVEPYQSCAAACLDAVLSSVLECAEELEKEGK